MHQISKIYFVTKLYMFRASEFQSDSPRKRPHNLHETYQLPCVQLITPDDGHRRCPKHVEFRDINSGYLMHLFGYFIRPTRCVETIMQLVCIHELWHRALVTRKPSFRRIILPPFSGQAWVIWGLVMERMHRGSGSMTTRCAESTTMLLVCM